MRNHRSWPLFLLSKSLWITIFSHWTLMKSACENSPWMGVARKFPSKNGSWLGVPPWRRVHLHVSWVPSKNTPKVSPFEKTSEPALFQSASAWLGHHPQSRQKLEAIDGHALSSTFFEGPKISPGGFSFSPKELTGISRWWNYGLNLDGVFFNVFAEEMFVRHLGCLSRG